MKSSLSVHGNLKGLAQSVIAQGMKDLVDLRGTFSCQADKEKTIVSAKSFLLAENEDLAFWCEIGELNMKAIVERAKKLLSGEQSCKFVVNDVEDHASFDPYLDI